MNLEPLKIGAAEITENDGITRLKIGPTPAGQYSNAQLYDYAGRSNFVCRAPLRLSLRAWASHPTAELRGTAGFGFWNQPIMPGQMLPRLPRAVWFFFASSPSDMAFALDVPGYGWKAATIDATRPLFLLLAPGAPLGFLLMRNPALYRRLWPIAQRAIGVHEKMLPIDLHDPHSYRLDWERDSARFFVDGVLITEAPYAPQGSLGFVIWIDNQFAIVTPQGKLGGGVVTTERDQWLAFENLKIEAS
jgi:hypothetical protein